MYTNKAPRILQKTLSEKGILVGDTLGQGGQGIVYSAQKDGEELAVKYYIDHVALHKTGSLQPTSTRGISALQGILGFKNLINGIKGLPTIHDWGIAGDIPYLVMERVTDEPMRDMMRSRKYGIRYIRDALCNAAEVLERLARHGTGHTDVKLDNLTQQFVLDADSLKTMPHRSFHIYGTLAYLSPEQVQGEMQVEKTDVFGLGATLYAALTRGMTPISRALQKSGSISQMSTAIEAPIIPPENSQTPMSQTGLNAIGPDPTTKLQEESPVQKLWDLYQHGINTNLPDRIQLETKDEMDEIMRYLMHPDPDQRLPMRETGETIEYILDKEERLRAERRKREPNKSYTI